MERQYERVPLAVDAVFTTSGEFRPRQLIYKGEHFDISRIIGVRRYCPCVVGCVAPIEYTVVVHGIEKKIDYEHDTNRWFSVREVR